MSSVRYTGRCKSLTASGWPFSGAESRLWHSEVYAGRLVTTRLGPNQCASQRAGCGATCRLRRRCRPKCVGRPQRSGLRRWGTRRCPSTGPVRRGWRAVGPRHLPCRRLTRPPNRAVPSRTRPCTSSCLERFPLRGHPPDPSPPRVGAAYRREVAFLLPLQEPHAVVPARMA